MVIHFGPQTGWSELADIADQVEDANAAARDEVASQRDVDHHLIYDDRPTRQEIEAAEPDRRYR